MGTDGRYRRIWNQVSIIPPGKVASYGQIAQLAGIPRGARMVGRALGRAPAELKLPWHRVLNAQGRIALPAGSRGYRLQQERLQQEGIEVTSGRVDLSRFEWRPTLDELVWGPRMLGASDPSSDSGT
jgi:methylated-DNA-protein-cysteine methyltransferase-like protein